VHPRLAVADIRTAQVTAQQPSPGEFREWAKKRIAEVFGNVSETGNVTGNVTPSLPVPITNPTPGNEVPKFFIEHEPAEPEPEPEPVSAPIEPEPVEPEPVDVEAIVDEPEELPAARAERYRVVRLRGPRRERDF
jgi:hypothetical protein